jgi:hypothetical protein
MQLYSSRDLKSPVRDCSHVRSDTQASCLCWQRSSALTISRPHLGHYTITAIHKLRPYSTCRKWDQNFQFKTPGLAKVQWHNQKEKWALLILCFTCSLQVSLASRTTRSLFPLSDKHRFCYQDWQRLGTALEWYYVQALCLSSETVLGKVPAKSSTQTLLSCARSPSTTRPHSSGESPLYGHSQSTNVLNTSHFSCHQLPASRHGTD